MLTRAQKREAVAELQGKFARASSVFIADYRGLSVASVDSLRRKLRAEGKGDFEYHVVKNSLLKRAVEGSGVAAIAQHFKGPTAVALAYGDPVGLAKVLVDFQKTHDVFALRAGVLEGKTLDKAEIATLATLPSLEQLRAKLIGLLLAPAQKVVGVIQAPAGQLARVVEARRKQLEEGGAA
jgi:large subunit ribosomal protein L10